jgi:SanA protein
LSGRRAAVAAAVAGAAAAGIVAANAWVLAAARGRAYRDPLAVPRCDVALIPGAGEEVIPGIRNPHFVLRVGLAAAVWRAGRAGRLVASGGPEEVPAMRRALEAAGVPAEAIADDARGISTLHTIRRAAADHAGERVMIVGETWHVPRALFYARAVGLDAVGCTARRSDPVVRAAVRSVRLGLVPAELREVAARVKAALVVATGRARRI